MTVSPYPWPSLACLHERLRPMPLLTGGGRVKSLGRPPTDRRPHRFFVHPEFRRGGLVLRALFNLFIKNAGKSGEAGEIEKKIHINNALCAPHHPRHGGEDVGKMGKLDGVLVDRRRSAICRAVQFPAALPTPRAANMKGVELDALATRWAVGDLSPLPKDLWRARWL